MKLIFLANLGSPASPTTSHVRHYLNSFLSDPRVIDLPAVLRIPLVYGLISPFRARRSAVAYQQIWTHKGSPLIHISHLLAEKVQKQLDPQKTKIHVASCMRYGEPSFASQWKKLKILAPEKILFVPLYPHYASSSTGSAVEDFLTTISKETYLPAIDIFPSFYDHSAFIESQAARFRELVHEPVDHVLMSFHGLPERHLRTSDPTQNTCQLTDACCSTPPAHCYRAHCFATARALAKALDLSEDRYSVSFQSRLGKDPWLKPFTDELILDLPKKNIRSLAIMCPSFVVDCLETLEEIAIRARSDFLNAGGQRFYAVPCVNASDDWVSGLATMIRLRL